MIRFLDPLRELTLNTMILRITMSMILGGLIGFERGIRGRAAGFRTYMLVCLGAALAVILSQYEYTVLETLWNERILMSGSRIDVSRYGAQVINGIGFLGAGTIIVTGRQEVKGVTTAAGLWASGCMGLAIGAGFYECAVIGFIYVVITNIILHGFSQKIIRDSKYMNIYIEFGSLYDLRKVLLFCREKNITVYDMELDVKHRKKDQDSSAVIFLGLNNSIEHSEVLARIYELECIRLIDEI